MTQADTLLKEILIGKLLADVLDCVVISASADPYPYS